jgi:ribose transport system ATP-binding protein
MDQVSAPLAEMIGVSKSYGGVEAVRNVDVTVGPGEVQALLGENGAGKSTLMKILSGEVGGHRGEIRIGAPAKFARRWTPSVPAWR